MAESPAGLSGMPPGGLPGPPIMAMNQAVASIQQQKRRSSTRSIKRKKFDDELVESSLVKSDRGRLKSSIAPTPVVASSLVPPIVTTATLPTIPATVTAAAAATAAFTAVPGLTTTTTTPSTSTQATIEIKVEPKPLEITPILPPPPEKKKNTGQKPPSAKTSSSKRSKKSKPPPPAASTKDLGRWKPQDDLSLITAVQQTNDLTAVHLGVSFSCKFTLKEIQERWYALLYDPVLSKLAINAIKQLHPDVIGAEQAKALFSKEEEALLGKISSTSQPNIGVFEDLLSKNPTVFHPARTAKILYSHWLLMKQYHLLPDQSVQPMPRGDHVLNFSDAEDMINDEDLKDPRDEVLEHELAVADRRQKKEIKTLEQELPKWQVLVDSVTGISPPDFDTQTLAVLRGRLVRYLMRSREITLGRATKDNPIDVDLSLEGPAWKISRRQGVIKLRSNGDFFIANEGKRPIYIDGKPVLTGNKQKLNNNSVVEISCLRFIFLINQDLIGIIRNEAQKLGT